MTNALFIDLCFLITFFVVLTSLATWLIFHLLLKQTMKMQLQMIESMEEDFDDEMTAQQIDDAFATSPVGIPPSLARD